jgi:hypothetical protein
MTAPLALGNAASRGLPGNGALRLFLQHGTVEWWVSQKAPADHGLLGVVNERLTGLSQ